MKEGNVKREEMLNKNILIICTILCLWGMPVKAEPDFIIPNSAEVIEEEAFYGNNQIHNVQLPDGIRRIEAAAFGNSSLKEINLPNSIEYIADNAFPTGVYDGCVRTNTGSYAYEWAKSHSYPLYTDLSNGFVYRVYHDKSCAICKYIGDSADISIPKMIDGLNVTTIESSFQNRNLRSVILPAGILYINEYAFCGNENLEYIELPDTIEYIGSGAFSGSSLSGMTTLKLPGKLKVIEESAFGGIQTEEIFLPNSLEAIPPHAFDWSSIKTIHIPSSIRYIGEAAFNYCDKIEDVYYDGTAEEWNQIEVEAANDLLLKAHIIFTDGEQESRRFTWFIEDGTLYINGEGVSDDYYYIGDSGISTPWDSRRDEVTSAVIGEGITELRGPALGYMYNLVEVTLPESLNCIGNTVFACSPLIEHIVVPGNVVSIGDCAFYETGIKEIWIPETVKTFGHWSFYGCPLTDIYYSGNQSEWMMIKGKEDAAISDGAIVHFEKPSKVSNGFIYTIAENHAVITGYNGEANDLVIPEELEGYPVTEVAFGLYDVDGSRTDLDTRVESIVLPLSVKKIAEGCFRNWSSLRSIIGLDSVEYVGMYCFSGTRIERLEFSSQLKEAGLYAFDINEMTYIRIPDTLHWKGLNEAAIDTWETVFLNHEYLETIDLIITGDTPTLTMDGPALYNANKSMLVCYPCKNDCCISYALPDTVTHSYAMAFDIRDFYNGKGLYELYIPSTAYVWNTNAFNNNVYVNGVEGEIEGVVFPRIVVDEGSWLIERFNTSGKKYFIRYNNGTTLEEIVTGIVSGFTTEVMSNAEKALVLNDYLKEHVEYDESLALFGAEDALIDAKGTCQSYSLAYALLLDACGIDNQYVYLESIRHSLNKVFLDEGWCYVDVTWNDGSGTNDYFGMDKETVSRVYGVAIEDIA